MRIDRAEAVSLIPAAGVLVTWAVLMGFGGGFEPSRHLPAGLVLVGLLALAMIGGGRVLPPGRAARIALGCFAAFVAWSFLSMTWSAAPANGWAESDLLLLTLVSSWTLALAPWRASTAWAALAFFSAAAAVACALTLVSALGESDLTARFTDLRWNAPLDYPNTAAAFALMAAIPALVLAARPDVPVVLSGVAQAVAVFLSGYALLPQSRGSILGGAATLIVLLLV